ncbi:DUF1850 domain-containing protein [Bacillota bacterium Meth-B3]
MKRYRRPLIAIAIAAALTAVTCWPMGWRVTVRNRAGELKYAARVKRGQLVWIVFDHSVNRSPVEDGYEPGDGCVTLRETRFRHYGAGIPDPEPGQTFEARDGYYAITGYDVRMPTQWTFVGRVADHRLRVGEDGEAVHYNQLARPGEALGLSADRWSLWKEIMSRLRP